MQTTIEPLRAQELDWIDSQSNHGRDLIQRFTSSSEVSLASFERSFERWFRSNPEPATINDALNGFGVLFGQLLADTAQLEFVIATDEQGSDLALFGYPGSGDVLLYPVNLIVKRWERGETGFFEELHAQLLESIAVMQKTQMPIPATMSGRLDSDACSR